MPLVLVQSRVHFGIINLLASLADRFEEERFRVKFGVDAENVEDDPRCGSVITGSDDIPVANDKDEFSLVVVIEDREGINGSFERLLAFGITRDLTNHKLVQQFGLPF